MAENIKIDKFRLKYLTKIIKIYKDSFPKEERFPFIILLLNLIRKNSKLFVGLKGREAISFMYVINYKKESFILYLAVTEEERNRGFGSYLLNWYLNNYKNTNIYLNVDEVDNKYYDNDIRKKRLNFYLSNGFYLTEYLSVEKNGNYNILSNKDKFDKDNYADLDSKISYWLFDNKSKIERIENYENRN